MNKKLRITFWTLLTIIVVSTVIIANQAFGSVPMRDANGCSITAGYPVQTAIPWYLVKGESTLEFTIYNLKCPPNVKTITEIKIPFGRVVGHLEEIHGDSYITVPTTNEIKYFPFNDVYVESKQDWDFKGVRHY